MLDATVGALRTVLRRPDHDHRLSLTTGARRRWRWWTSRLHAASAGSFASFRSVRQVVARHVPHARPYDLAVADAIRIAARPSPATRDVTVAGAHAGRPRMMARSLAATAAAATPASGPQAFRDQISLPSRAPRRLTFGDPRQHRLVRRAGAHRRTVLDAVGPMQAAALASVRRSTDQLLVRALARASGLAKRDRALPVGLAMLLVVASILSFGPTSLRGGTGAVEGAGQDARVAVLGADSGPQNADQAVAGTGNDQPGPISATAPQVAARILAAEGDAGPIGPYSIDGTLLKPIAVDTSVPDASDELQTYRVRAGDTLTGIASRFGISMMTIWWANHLKSKDDLHLGQTLVIPPVSGIVVTVKEGDTLDSIAAASGVDASEIAAYNGLQETQLVIGQVLVVPGGRGDAIATPKPAPAATSHTTRATTSTVRPPVRYSGGKFVWPVPGGYISQYFHTGHYAIDIANDWGSPIVAAAAGTVIYAGWKNNGGGYQVWISHGSNLYTTYNHMSSVSVGRGQHVARGQFIGRVGATGDATGPHCHFEVWIGYVWASGSRRVNPLNYF